VNELEHAKVFQKRRPLLAQAVGTCEYAHNKRIPKKLGKSNKDLQINDLDQSLTE